MKTKCNCEKNEFGYHEFECAVVTELFDKKPLFYSVDGEIDDGGVFVIPGDTSCIWVKHRDYYFRAKVYPETVTLLTSDLRCHP
jgi:hypothetical protein